MNHHAIASPVDRDDVAVRLQADPENHRRSSCRRSRVVSARIKRNDPKTPRHASARCGTTQDLPIDDPQSETACTASRTARDAWIGRGAKAIPIRCRTRTTAGAARRRRDESRDDLGRFLTLGQKQIQHEQENAATGPRRRPRPHPRRILLGSHGRSRPDTITRSPFSLSAKNSQVLIANSVPIATCPATDFGMSVKGRSTRTTHSDSRSAVGMRSARKMLLKRYFANTGTVS